MERQRPKRFSETICIGNQIKRWNLLKDDLKDSIHVPNLSKGDDRDKIVACLLLDCYYAVKNCNKCSNIVFSTSIRPKILIQPEDGADLDLFLSCENEPYVASDDQRDVQLSKSVGGRISPRIIPRVEQESSTKLRRCSEGCFMKGDSLTTSENVQTPMHSSGRNELTKGFASGEIVFPEATAVVKSSRRKQDLKSFCLRSPLDRSSGNERTNNELLACCSKGGDTDNRTNTSSDPSCGMDSERNRVTGEIAFPQIAVVQESMGDKQESKFPSGNGLLDSSNCKVTGRKLLASGRSGSPEINAFGGEEDSSRGAVTGEIVFPEATAVQESLREVGGEQLGYLEGSSSGDAMCNRGSTNRKAGIDVEGENQPANSEGDVCGLENRAESAMEVHGGGDDEQSKRMKVKTEVWMEEQSDGEGYDEYETGSLDDTSDEDYQLSDDYSDEDFERVVVGGEKIEGVVEQSEDESLSEHPERSVDLASGTSSTVAKKRGIKKQSQRRAVKRSRKPRKARSTYVSKTERFVLNDRKKSLCDIKFKPYLEVVLESTDETSKSKKRIESVESTTYLPPSDSEGTVMKYRCKACGSVSKALKQMKNHILHAEIGKLVGCEVCGEFYTKPGLLTHMRKHQPSALVRPKREKKLHKCTYEGCTYTAGRSTLLSLHVSCVHLNHRIHACQWEGCDKRFNTSYALEVHTRIHTGYKPIVCYLCGYQCRQKAALNWHMKSKHPGNTHPS